MHDVHLPSIDMNLLVALDAMLAEKSVTRAAKRIGLTQPAMSHALSRLRELLNDPLFVRTPAGMQPTARALGMSAPISRSLREIEAALAEQPSFDPKTATRLFTIATSDYVELVMLPALLKKLSREAPGIDVSIRDIPLDCPGALAEGTLDVAIGPPVYPQRLGLHAEMLFRERFVCLVRKGNPLARGKLTLDRFCEASHALISPRGLKGGYVDDALARIGRARRVAVSLSHFLVAPHVIAETDLIITVGERVARAFQEMMPLQVLAPPAELDIDGFTMSQFWHERHAHDPSHVWLRNELRTIARAA